MIVKLEFDLFFTVVEIPYISEEKLREGLYNKLEKWIHRNGLVYDDDAVISWFRETKFDNNSIKILEKHKSNQDKSQYDCSITLYF